MSSTEITSDRSGKASNDDDNVFESAWRAFTSSVRKEIAVIAGVLAFVRLLAVSHLDLDTARAILQHGDLTELAGGLVLSAALLWLPILVGIVAHGFLSMQSTDDGRRVVVVDLVVGLLSVAGIFLTFAVFDIDLGDLDEIARGGLSFGAVAALIGTGGAAVVHYAKVSADAQRRTLELALAAMDAERDREREPEPDLEPDVVDDDPGVRSVSQRLRDGGSKVFRALWLGAMSLWLIVLALLIVLAVLTEPSQPAENVTIAQNGTTETRTVHVIDDGGDEWIVMLRDSRRILSVDASSVTDRYICRAVGISRRETRAVDAKTVVPMRSGSPAPADGEDVYDAAEVRRRSEELESDVLRPAAERWVKRMSEQPPPCQPEWSSSEVAVVRGDLGLVCNDLGRCERTPERP